jgi:hypothetical protein
LITNPTQLAQPRLLDLATLCGTTPHKLVLKSLLSHTTNGTTPIDIDFILQNLKINDTIAVQDPASSSNYQTWRINGTPTTVAMCIGLSP